MAPFTQAEAAWLFLLSPFAAFAKPRPFLAVYVVSSTELRALHDASEGRYKVPTDRAVEEESY